jgi:hypothetical protein
MFINELREMTAATAADLQFPSYKSCSSLQPVKLSVPYPQQFIHVPDARLCARGIAAHDSFRCVRIVIDLRDFDEELRLDPGNAVEINRAAVPLDDRSCQAQAEPCAGSIAFVG